MAMGIFFVLYIFLVGPNQCGDHLVLMEGRCMTHWWLAMVPVIARVHSNCARGRKGRRGNGSTANATKGTARFLFFSFCLKRNSESFITFISDTSELKGSIFWSKTLSMNKSFSILKAISCYKILKSARRKFSYWWNLYLFQIVFLIINTF